MKKRSWGRVGAAMGVVALLAGGLVGAAGPANADETETLGEYEEYCSDLSAVNSSPEWLVEQCENNPNGTPGLVGPWRAAKVAKSWGQAYKAVGNLIPLDNNEDTNDSEPVQKAPPPPPCWGSTISNCPVGGALRFTAPKYAMVGVPVTMYAYLSWRPDANSPAQPTNGSAVIRVDGEDYSGVEFKDGIAEWRFIPETEGMKEFTASGVVSSGISGANAYIDTVEARTYVLEYDPVAYVTALKNKRVEVGETYVITDLNQARSYLDDRYEWSVSEKSDDVCAVYETKNGAVKAKFTDSGKCTVIWMDKESEEEGKYTFIAKK